MIEMFEADIKKIKKELLKKKNYELFGMKAGESRPKNYDDDNAFLFELIVLQYLGNDDPFKIIHEKRGWIDWRNDATNLHSLDILVLNKNDSSLYAAQVKKNKDGSDKLYASLKKQVDKINNNDEEFLSNRDKLFQAVVKQKIGDALPYWFSAKENENFTEEVYVKNFRHLIALHYHDKIFKKPVLGQYKIKSLQRMTLENKDVAFGIVSIEELVKFGNLVKKNGHYEYITDQNVRGVMNARKGVKAGIFKSLENENDMLRLNNGIAIIADTLRPSGTMTVVNPQIINGQQTFESIMNADKKKLDLKGSLLVKFIEEADYAEISKLSNATNAQIVVKFLDLISTSYDQSIFFKYLARYGMKYKYKSGTIKLLNGFKSNIPKDKIEITSDKVISGILSTIFDRPDLCVSHEQTIFKPLYNSFLAGECKLTKSNDEDICKLYEYLSDIPVDKKLELAMVSVKYAKLWASEFMAEVKSNHFTNHFATSIYKTSMNHFKGKKLIGVDQWLRQQKKKIFINILKKINDERKVQGYYNKVNDKELTKVEKGIMDAKIRKDREFKI